MPPRRHAAITIFVICWTLIFHYETLRANYLSPLVFPPSRQDGTGRLIQRELPKLPLLFPPAGWIMFFNIDQRYGFAEVYGIRNGQPILLDPHDIFETKALGYDNIHRNMLIAVLSQAGGAAFCRYVGRTFPDYDAFAVVYAQYPDLIETPDRILRQVAYRCQ